MYATLEGKVALKGTIVLPLQGLWTAALEVDSDVPWSGVVSLQCGDATLALTGFVESGAVVHGRYLVRLVGGHGGLAKTVQAKPYQGPPFLLPLKDLLSDCEETLSSTVLQDDWNGVQAHWLRMSERASHALDAICKAAGANWRALPDGTIWAGVETWPAFSGTCTIMSEAPQFRRLEVSAEDALVLPGVTANGQRISRVQHSIEKSKFRTTCWYEP